MKAIHYMAKAAFPFFGPKKQQQQIASICEVVDFLGNLKGGQGVWD